MATAICASLQRFGLCILGSRCEACHQPTGAAGGEVASASAVPGQPLRIPLLQAAGAPTRSSEGALQQAAIEMIGRAAVDEDEQERIAIELSRVTWLAEEEKRKRDKIRSDLQDTDRQRRHLWDHHIPQLETGGEAAGSDFGGVRTGKTTVARVSFGTDCRVYLEQARRLYQDETGVRITLLDDVDHLKLEHDDAEVLQQTQIMLQQDVLDRKRIQDKLKSHEDELAHMFIDQSNVFIGSQKVTRASGVTEMDSRMRLNAGDLVKVMARGRDVLEKHVAGSTLNDGSDALVWQKWRDCMCRVHLEKREKGHSEKSVDDILIAQIGLALPRFTSTKKARHTLVLATGDGKGNHDRCVSCFFCFSLCCMVVYEYALVCVHGVYVCAGCRGWKRRQGSVVMCVVHVYVHVYLR
jgi:hypothetical protein